MLPIASPKTPILAPAVGQPEIEAFLEQELAAGRPQPTLRALHARFRGSYRRLNRIRREFLAQNTPAAAAAPAAPSVVDLAPLLNEVEKVGTALGELRRDLLPRLTGSSDQLARIEARVSAPAAKPSPAPPIALDVIESRLFDQDQAIRELSTAVRELPATIIRIGQEAHGQLELSLPELIRAAVRSALRKKKRRGRRPQPRKEKRRRRARRSGRRAAIGKRRRLKQKQKSRPRGRRQQRSIKPSRRSSSTRLRIRRR